MASATPAQLCQQMIADAAKVVTVPDGTPLIIAPRQCQGFSQLRGSILSDKAGAIIINQNPFPNLAVPPAAGTWSTVFTQVLVPGVLTEFVVDITQDYVQITYLDAATGVDANIEIAANLWPISALESNRAATNPDIVAVALGANGAFGAIPVDNAGGAGPTTIMAATVTRKNLQLKNWGDRVVYVGFTNAVTAANGYPLQPEGVMNINFTTAAVWGLAEAGIQSVRFIHELE